jgi:hypothetical protein
MAFKVKNLMIHVLPDVDENSQVQLVSGQIQSDDCSSNWLSLPGGCVFGSGLQPPFTDLDDLLSDPLVLATVKRQLQEALARVQEQEQAIDEKMRLKTVEDAQALEKQLVVALDEVRLQKERLMLEADGGQE